MLKETFGNRDITELKNKLNFQDIRLSPPKVFDVIFFLLTYILFILLRQI